MCLYGPVRFMTLICDNISGKLSRDSVSGKLMRPVPLDNDCEFCDPGATPSTIGLTISSLTDCGCVYLGSDYYSVHGLVNILNGSTHSLIQYGSEGEYGGQSCIWARNYTGGYFGTLRSYWTSNCSGAYLEYPIEDIGLYVEKAGSSLVHVEIAGLVILPGAPSVQRSFLIYDYGVWNVTRFTAKAATLTDCIVFTDLANQAICGEVYGSGNPVCGNGVTSVVEGAPTTTMSQYRTPISDLSVQWGPGLNNYQQVNDAPGVPDDDTSYTTTNVGTYKDFFNITPYTIPYGNVTNLQVTGRFKRLEAGGSFLARMMVRVNGVTYYGPAEQFVLGAYFTRTATWTTNPNTGLAWTRDDINGIGSTPLQAIGYECMGFQKIVRCTQVYSKVEYTP